MVGSVALRVFIILQCLTLIQSAVNPRFQLVIYNVTCHIMSPHVKRFDCDSAKLAKSQYVFNQYFMFSKNIGKDFEARVLIQVQPNGADKPWNFVDVRLKLCPFLKKPVGNRLLTKVQAEIKKSSNLPISCPFKANFQYKFINLSISDAFIPPYAPFLNFTYIAEFYENKIFLAFTKTVGAIVPEKN